MLHDLNKKVDVSQVPRYIKRTWDLKSKMKLKTVFFTDCEKKC